MELRARRDAAALWICALYALATSAWYVVWRHAFAERSADEALFENILWNVTHGHGLRTAAEGGLPHLAVHFSPALYLLAPLYALTGSMHAVHFLVSALTAAAGLAFHRHVSRALGEQAALPALVAFLLTPTIVLQTFMEFHEQALAILPLTLLLAAWSDGRRTAALVSALALLTVREDNALLVAALGALSLADPRRRASGGLLLALGLAWLGLWQAAAPLLAGGRALPGVFAETYSAWGATPAAVARSVLTRPMDVLRHVLAPVPLKYLALLLAPVLGVLPFGSALVFAAVPALLLVLLADHDARQFQIRMHYSLAPAVVLLFASVATLRRLEASPARLARLARRWATVAMMAVTLLLAPGWVARAVSRLNPYAAQIRDVLATLPDTASVTAPGYLLNHLAARPRFELAWREELPSTEYIVLEDSSRLFFRGTTVDAFHTPRFDSLLTAGGYEQVLDRGGWHVYRRIRPASER